MPADRVGAQIFACSCVQLQNIQFLLPTYMHGEDSIAKWDENLSHTGPIITPSRLNVRFRLRILSQYGLYVAHSAWNLMPGPTRKITN